MTSSPLHTNPFPGLRAFHPNESYLFFGRENHTAHLLEKFKTVRFIAILGVSGSGKSSLVTCGMIPELQGGYFSEEGSHWEVFTFRPGSSPIKQLSKVLAQSPVFDPGFASTSFGNETYIESELRRSRLGLIDFVKESNLPSNKPLLFIIDQFEELFRYSNRYGSDAEKQSVSDNNHHFVQLLLEASNQNEVPIYICITMRSDFIGECVCYPGLAEAINEGQYLVPRMRRSELRTAIIGPIAVKEASISERLLIRLLNETGDAPDQLPILQHALNRTWDFWSKHNNHHVPLDIPQYEAIGAMRDALSRHADIAYDQLPNAHFKQLCESIFKALTKKGKDQKSIRNPLSFEKLCHIVDATPMEVGIVIDQFRNKDCSFLLPGNGQELSPQTTIDITHESLIRNWNKLRAWVDEESKSVEVYIRLSEAAVLFQQQKTGLWRPPELDIAKNWLANNAINEEWATQYNLDYDKAIEFLKLSSIKWEEEQAQKEQLQAQKVKRNLNLAFLFGVISIIAIGLAIWGYLSTQKAESASIRSNALYLASEANQFIEKDNVKALAFSKKAWELTLPNPLPSVQKAISKAAFYTALSPLYKSDLIHPNPINHTIYHPKSKLLATLDEKNVIRIWNLEGNKLVKFAPHQSSINEIAFTADGHFLLSASADSTGAVYNVQRGEEVLRLSHTGKVVSIAAHPSGQQILTASNDGTAHIWDRKGNEIISLKAHHTELHEAKYAPDGGNILTIGEDNFATLWNREGLLIKKLQHASEVFLALFSPDSRLIATASWDNTVRIWDLHGALVAHLNAHKGKITAVHFSPDSKNILTTSSDRKAILWDLKGKPIQVFDAHTDQVTGGEFSKDGEYIITYSLDKSVKLWNFAGTKIQDLSDHNSHIRSASFSNNGRYILCTTGNHIVKIWNIDGSLHGLINMHHHYINPAYFTLDDQYVVTSSWDKTVKIWDFQNTFLQVSKMPDKNTEELILANDDGYITPKLKQYSGNGKLLSALVKTSLPNSGVLHAGISSDFSKAIYATDHVLYLHDLKKDTIYEWTRFAATINQLFHSGDLKFVALSLSNKTVLMVNTISRVITPIKADPIEILDAAINDEQGQLITVSTNGTVQTWFPNGQLKMTFLKTVSVSNLVKLSPFGRYLIVTFLDGSFDLWDLKEGTQQTIKSHTRRIWQLTFARNEAYFLTSSADNTARLWDIKGHLMTTFGEHIAPVKQAKFSNDLRYIVTGSDDYTAKLWDLEGNLLANMNQHNGAVKFVGFTTKDSYIYTIDERKVIRRWPTPKTIYQKLSQPNLLSSSPH